MSMASAGDTEMPNELKANIAKLNNKRSYIKRCLTMVERETADATRLSDGIKRIEMLMTAYNEFEESIFEPEHEHIFPVLDEETDRIYNLKKRLPSSTEAQAVQSDSASISTNNLKVKLPTINLPTFSGVFTNWYAFIDKFESLVGSNEALNDLQKLQYLKASLKGDAADILANIQTKAANYGMAMELLKQSFQNKRIIHQKHMDELFAPPKIVKEEAIYYRQLLNGVMQHMRALEIMERPVEHWDDIFVQLLRSRLTASTRLDWEKSLTKDEIPSFEKMREFLIKKYQSLEVSNETDTRRISKRSLPVNVNIIKCNFCADDHTVLNCKSLLELDISERIKRVAEKKLCKNCLRFGHKTSDCNSTNVCKKCKQKHHTLLHLPRQANVQPSTALPIQLSKRDPEVLLPTCTIQIKDRNGNLHAARALLDSGSQLNLITRHLSNKLKLPKKLSQIEIIGVGKNDTGCSLQVNAKIYSHFKMFNIEAQCYVLDAITSITPSRLITTEINLPNNITLADPDFNKPSHIDILIGSEFFYQLLTPGKMQLGHITLQNTEFGWTIAGKTAESSGPQICTVTTFAKLNSQLEKFWEIEHLETTAPNVDESYAIQLFDSTTERDESGKFIVKLPWNSNPTNLGSTYNIAEKRLFRLENKFKRQPNLHKEYNKFMNEYKELGHMVRVKLSESDLHSSYILPHHGVIRESSATTKLRVVFDASAKSSSGASLNDILLTGPNLQEDLFNIIVRFRSHQYVATADVRMMYRQIRVSEEDCTYQRILWRESPLDEIEVYQLNTVTYGTACAPFLAIKSLQTLANDAPAHIKTVLTKEFYMDDMLTGAATISDLLRICDEVNTLLKGANFHLRKWASNDSRILQGFDKSSCSDQTFIIADDNIKALGVSWTHTNDSIVFKLPDHKVLTDSLTKREILSSISRFFDPLGILGPVIILAKIILQKLWQLKLDWDQPVPETIASEWRKLEEEFRVVETITIPRKIISSAFATLEIHAFGDASIRAYGSAIYLKSKCTGEDPSIILICAKSRVAPLKSLTLPRLELCAAVLTAQLAERVNSSIPYKIEATYFYSDSTIVLSWINSSSTAFKPFVSHRIGEIHRLTKPQQWRHVRSENNPADIISRGVLPSELRDNQCWFHGPSILSEDYVPEVTLCDTVSVQDELRVLVTNMRHINDNDFLSFINRTSRYTQLLRIAAWILRFIGNIRNSKQTGELSAIEINSAERQILRLVQYAEFRDEINQLSKNQTVDSRSRLFALHPFLDDDGLLRVGGRLRHSQLNFDSKFPVLLPKNNHVSDLIIRHYHEESFHTGAQGTQANIRTKFWILSARSQVRNIISKCVRCFKAKPIPVTPMMGDLPAYRSEQIRAFTKTGIDFCGPFQLKEGKRKTAQSTKVYAAAFVCMSTRAVHLEVVSELSTDAFLAALRRFISRRGYPSDLFTDNGTNFVGADRELRNYFKILGTSDKLQNFTAEKRVKWHFIPPAAPHFGGLWEAVVKRVKFHLRRVAGNASLRFEELSTLLCQIEAILNSRPLAPLSSDPSDLSCLTPAHFLIGAPLMALPEADLKELKLSRLSRWQHIQQLQQHFWTRWSKEYLQELQVRHRWKKSTGASVQVGQLALIKEDNLPPLKWKTGRVIEIHPGSDGNVRAATLRTAHGVTKRPAVKLCPFPSDP